MCVVFLSDSDSGCVSAKLSFTPKRAGIKLCVSPKLSGLGSPSSYPSRGVQMVQNVGGGGGGEGKNNNNKKKKNLVRRPQALPAGGPLCEERRCPSNCNGAGSCDVATGRRTKRTRRFKAGTVHNQGGILKGYPTTPFLYPLWQYGSGQEDYHEPFLRYLGWTEGT